MVGGGRGEAGKNHTVDDQLLKREMWRTVRRGWCCWVHVKERGRERQ